MRYVRVAVDLSRDESDDSDDVGMCIVFLYIFQRSWIEYPVFVGLCLCVCKISKKVINGF